MSETCRVIINQVKQKLHLVGYLLIRYFKDARYHKHKNWSLKLNEAHRLRVIDKMLLKKVFGPNREELREGCRKFHNDVLRALKVSPNIQAIS